jgi:hypothetical protein
MAATVRAARAHGHRVNGPSFAQRTIRAERSSRAVMSSLLGQVVLHRERQGADAGRDETPAFA